MHVSLEWMQGLFQGLALALGMAMLVRRERVHAPLALPRWTGIVAVFFILWVIPYLNACRVSDRWMRDAEFPETVLDIRPVGGFVASRGWGLKTALFGDKFAGYVNDNHIRFGPNNTNDKK